MSTKGSSSKKTIGFVHLIIFCYIQKIGKCGFIEETRDILLLPSTEEKAWRNNQLLKVALVALLVCNQY